MPLYEYQCKKCGHRFEKIQKFSDKPVKKCPECGGPVEQVISAPAVQFKGSGWYVTDYAKKPSSGSSSGNSASGSSSSNNGESAKTETKSESKSESSTKKEDKPKAESKKAEKK